MRSGKSARLLIAAGLLPLALSACSSTGSAGGTAASQDTAPAAAPTASASPATTPDPNAGLLTGTRLKQALAPATALPSGFALDTGGSRDTGDTFQEPTAADVPKPDCSKLGGTAWSAITGIEGVSFAQNDYIDKATSAEVAQEVDVYRGTTAQTVMQALGMVSKACPSYTDDQTHAKVRITEKAATGLGDGAWTITLTSSGWQGGTTLIAARKGTAVVTVLASSSKDAGAGNAKSIAGRILQALPTGS
ncbi:hypothetical protein [Kitasatospora paranensis]|uniref:PknH-like extracellular domain-containing protein n=1 Tax=Kitasatospora paranensis TaxID=258053 RepID=A0ABW2FXK3_9ACTN